MAIDGPEHVINPDAILNCRAIVPPDPNGTDGGSETDGHATPTHADWHLTSGAKPSARALAATATGPHPRP
eukprot:3796337-Lingulodinium_polyedra.AAC.1